MVDQLRTKILPSIKACRGEVIYIIANQGISNYTWIGAEVIERVGLIGQIFDLSQKEKELPLEEAPFERH